MNFRIIQAMFMQHNILIEKSKTSSLVVDARDALIKRNELLEWNFNLQRIDLSLRD